jgi:hypothetical protein
MDRWLSYFRRGMHVTMILPAPTENVMQGVVDMVSFSAGSRLWDANGLKAKVERTARELHEALTRPRHKAGYLTVFRSWTCVSWITLHITPFI